jgi:predicted PurR-regulated permease PerM
MLEAYTLNAALMAYMLLFLVRYDRTAKPAWLCASTFFWGLGVANHVLMGLFIAAFLAVAVVLIVRPRPRAGLHVLAAILAFLAGAGLYLVLFVRDLLENMATSDGGLRSWLESAGRSFQRTFVDATGGSFRQRMFTRGLPAETLRFWRINYLFFLFYNFPTPALVMAGYGLWAFWKRKEFRISFIFVAAGLVVLAVWSANYFVWDMFAFAMPVYVLLSVPIGLCAARLLQAPKALRTVFLTLILPMLIVPGIVYDRMDSWYRRVPSLQRFFDSYPDMPLTTHTWHPVEYISNPNKRSYDKVERYARALFAVLPKGAHFLGADSRADYPLRYYYRDQLGERLDITYHSIYSPQLTEAEASGIAADLKRLLDRGEPVFTSSILLPEKPVLDQLFLMYHPTWTLERIERLPLDEYVARFPAIALQKIVLSEEDEAWIYRLSPRAPAAQEP